MHTLANSEDSEKSTSGYCISSWSTLFVQTKTIFRERNTILFGNFNLYTVKPVLSGHSKIDKTEVLKTSGSLVQVKSIAECSNRAFCNTFDLH